jgi:hypothetical protein
LLLTPAILVLIGVGVAACGGGTSPACELVTDGAVESVIVFGTLDGELHDLVDGSRVPLIAAPQGGHILLIGARMRGVSGCSININAAVRDPCNDRVLGLEQRPISLTDRGDGWAVPVDPDELSNFANVAVCPVEAASHDLDGSALEVEVRLTDGMGRVVSELTATITPTCDAGDSFCRCECDIDPGTDCAVDAVDADPGCGAQDASLQ